MERETRAIPKVSGLTQRLFSWSLEDIQNEDLYKTQVLLFFIILFCFIILWNASAFLIVILWLYMELVLCWIMILKLAIGYSPTSPELGSFIYRPSQFTCSSVEAFLVYAWFSHLRLALLV